MVVLRSGGLAVDLAVFHVCLEGTHIPFTPTEFRTLLLLMEYSQTTVSHGTIEDSIWGDDFIENAAALRRTYIKRIRDKLGDDARHPYWIANDVGRGYRFLQPVFWKQNTSFNE